MKYFPLQFLLLIFLIQCGTSIPSNDADLAPPEDFTVTALSGERFQISYYVTNEEDIFDGYNLYISRVEITDSMLNTLIPLNLTGSEPTFSHRPEDYDPFTNIDEVISTQDGITGFSSGTTYYFRMTAHSYTATESIGSGNESATAQN